MSDDRPTFGSLFSGIGGIDLGLERAGWEVRWQVEWDPFCQHVLAHHWPDVPRYGDIAAVDWSRVEPVDLLVGGFPCQPISAAGKQLAQEDERWLWPEFLRAIRALRPRLVLVENVTNLLAVNDGSAFGEVVGDLAESGYDAEWDCIPASAVGALHDRDRIWIVAYPRRLGLQSGGRPGQTPGATGAGAGEGLQREWGWNPAGDGSPDAGSLSSVADPDGRRFQVVRLPEPGRLKGPSGGEPDRRGAVRELDHGEALADADLSRSQGHGRLDRGRDGAGEWAPGPGRWAVNGWWDVEPHVGRLAHGVPARVDQLRALGNAVVPQVVEALDPILRDRLR